VERPSFFNTDAAPARNDGAKYADELEAMMDAGGPVRAAVKLKPPRKIGDEDDEDDDGKPKELKEAREAMATDADIEKLNSLFGLSAASKAE